MAADGRTTPLVANQVAAAANFAIRTARTHFHRHARKQAGRNVNQS